MFFRQMNLSGRIRGQLESRWLPLLLMLALTVWLNWHFFRAVSEHGTVLLETGEFYGDRLINMGVAKTAQELGINFLDPFNRMEPIFYQFPGWWGLGYIARFTGLQPWAAANLVHLFFVPAFFLVAWRLAGTITRSRHAVIAGIAILFLFGNLEWFFSHEYLKTYGAHAVMLPFLQQIFGFYIDSYGMLCGYAALLAWLGYLQAEKPGWKQLAVFWLAAVVAVNLHFLPAIFFIVIIMSQLFGLTLAELDILQRRKLFIILAGIAALYLAALWYWSFRPPMSFLGITAGLVWLVLAWHDRKRVRYLLPLLPVVTLVLLAGANLLSFKAYYTFLLNDYNDTVRKVALGIPAHVLLICYFPVVVLTLVALARETDSRWRWLKGCMVLAAVAVIFNDQLGYNNHPYRFVPYTYPLWALLAGDGLVRLLRSWRQPGSAIILSLTGAALGLGIWSNIDHRRSYAVADNCKPVHPLVLKLAAAIEAERKTAPGTIFYLEPTIFGADRLAPYSGARFFSSAYINFRSAYRHYPTYEEMLPAARALALRVDYLILPRTIDGLLPVRELTWGEICFRFYRLGDEQ